MPILFLNFPSVRTFVSEFGGESKKLSPPIVLHIG